MNHYVIPGIAKHYTTLEEFLKLASVFSGVSEEEIKGGNRSDEVKAARHLYCYLSRKYTKFTFKTIAHLIGNRHYSTSMNSVNVVKNSIEVDKDFANRMEQLEAGISNKPIKENLIVQFYERKKPIPVKKFERPKAEYSNRQY